MSSPKHDLHDLAARFARKARSDEIALEKLADSASEARALVPWAVEFRYDDILDERLDRAVACKAVTDVRGWVDGVLGGARDS